MPAAFSSMRSVIDVHYYSIFGDELHNMTAQQNIDLIRRGERREERGWKREARRGEVGSQDLRWKGKEKLDDGGWSVVQRRRSLPSARPLVHKVGSSRVDVSSFFFTHFPQGTLRGVFWKIFRNYGDVCDIFLPNRVGKDGMAFGFVKFRNVVNREDLARKLDNIFIGDMKLWANLDRSSPKTIRSKKGLVRQRERVEMSADGSGPKGGSSEKEGLVPLQRSFAQVVKDSDEHFSSSVISLEADQNNLRWLRNSMVGKLQKEVSISEVRNKMLLEGYAGFRLAFMGDNFVLISADSAELLREAVRSNPSPWSEWFDCISVWSPGLLPSRKEVWVRLTGLPLHVWTKPSFELILSKFGKLLQLDPVTEQRSKLDFARVKLDVMLLEKIDVCLEVEVDSIKFKVKIWEEQELGPVIPEVGVVNECDSSVNSHGSEVGEWVAGVEGDGFLEDSEYLSVDGKCQPGLGNLGEVGKSLSHVSQIKKRTNHIATRGGDCFMKEKVEHVMSESNKEVGQVMLKDKEKGLHLLKERVTRESNKEVGQDMLKDKEKGSVLAYSQSRSPFADQCIASGGCAGKNRGVDSKVLAERDFERGGSASQGSDVTLLSDQQFVEKSARGRNQSCMRPSQSVLFKKSSRLLVGLIPL